jgi:hypothetical protein
MKFAGIILFLFAFVTSTCWAANGDPLVVSQDGAALHDAPREDAPVLLRLNRGHSLVEEERRDSWVRVTVPGVHLPGRETWLPDSAVAARQPEPEEPQAQVEILQDEVAGPPDLPSSAILLRVVGSALGFRSECRLILRDGSVRNRTIRGNLPATVELGADAASCLVSKQGAVGTLRAELRIAGALQAFAETSESFGTVQVSTDGTANSYCCDDDRFVFFAVPFRKPHRPHRPMAPPPVSGNPVPPFTQSPVPSFQ